jgi:hypothetical protein
MADPPQLDELVDAGARLGFFGALFRAGSRGPCQRADLPREEPIPFRLRGVCVLKLRARRICNRFEVAGKTHLERHVVFAVDLKVGVKSLVNGREDDVFRTLAIRVERHDEDHPLVGEPD